MSEFSDGSDANLFEVSVFEVRVRMFGADHNPFFITFIALSSALFVMIVAGLTSVVSTVAVMGFILVAITSLFRAKDELDLRHAVLVGAARAHATPGTGDRLVDTSWREPVLWPAPAVQRSVS